VAAEKGGPFVDIVPQIDSDRIGAAIESALRADSGPPDYQPVLAGKDGVFVQKKNAHAGAAVQFRFGDRAAEGSSGHRHERSAGSGRRRDAYHFFHGADVMRSRPKGRHKSDAVRISWPCPPSPPHPVFHRRRRRGCAGDENLPPTNMAASASPSATHP